MPAVSSPRSDAYTGLLLLSLLAQVAGTVFLFLDYSRYPPGAPPKPPTLSASSANPSTPAPAMPTPAAPAPAGPAPVAPQ
jgi:hypothetical protein